MMCAPPTGQYAWLMILVPKSVPVAQMPTMHAPTTLPSNDFPYNLGDFPINYSHFFYCSLLVSPDLAAPLDPIAQWRVLRERAKQC